MDRVPDLLAIIACETVKVTVDQLGGMEPIDIWVGNVLAACPVLEELSFRNGQFLNLQAVVDRAASGTSRLRCLSLVNVMTVNFQFIRSFIQVLCDPRHLLTKHLRELRIDLWIQDNNIHPLLLILQEMLRTNRTLQKFSLGFQLAGDSLVLRPMFETAFAAHLAQEVVVATGPADLRSKLAFLSALHTNHPATAEAMEVNVLASVFQFAALSILRDFQMRILVPVDEIE